MIITCPNPKCGVQIDVADDCTEVMCYGCGVTIDLPMPEENNNEH